MVTATLFFKKSVEVSDLVSDLQALPESIRPIYFAENEGKIVNANVLSDEVRFQNFRKANPTGFFLYTKNKRLIDVSTRRVGYTEVTLWLEAALANKLVPVFFSVFSERNPFFGFSCDESEYKHRNRYYITIGKNHIEDWVGRDLEKYMSGVYWYTLLSDGLLKQHGINLSELSADAMVTEPLGDGSLHLLKFFEHPEYWKENANRLDDLCERADGVFSRRLVEKVAAGITDYLEYDEAITQWR